MLTCRKAVADDVNDLYELINDYAEKGIMLPRTIPMISAQLDHFVVAVLDGQMVGCGSLFRLGEDLVEIRSLGIKERYKGKGIGSALVEFLTEEAREQRIPKLMALTYEAGFFERHGFHVVEKEIFPEKVWTDCVYCKKQSCCDEIAVLKRLNSNEIT